MRSITRRSTLRYIGGLTAVSARGTWSSDASAKGAQLRIAYQPGLNYLPLMVLEHDKLIEAEHARNNMEAKVSWLKFSSGGPMNDALLAGQIDIASGGITVLAILWDKTRGHQNVRGLTSLVASPCYLNVNNPSIRALSDFTDRDRIAVPIIKISPNAIVLQMAAEKLFGNGPATSVISGGKHPRRAACSSAMDSHPK